MAKEVKPGKRFKYSLESVLKVRGIKEKKEQEKFADKKRAYLDEKMKEEEIERQREQRRDELRAIMKRGPISDFAKVMRRKAHLGKLREDLDVQIEKVVEASQKLEEQRAHLIESMKEKKIIEKHKGQRFDEYKKAMEKIEMKFMDEIATQRFKHEKKED